MRKYTSPDKKSSHLLKILFLTVVATILAIVLIKILNVEKFVVRGPKTVVQLITDTGLKKDNGRTNILLLGTGGAGHDGPDLSDTMILASLDKDGEDPVMISIPRDLWAPSLTAKINSAYAFGQEKNKEGLELASTTISELLGIPVHYAVRVDFDGFINAVDLVGGLDIDVETAFVDPKYPIPGKENDLCGIEIETKEEEGLQNVYFKDATGSATLLTEQNDPFECRYETLTFKKGHVNMDGKTALKFARSRLGSNGEGNDFARSARQQKVILAFREKIISSETLLNPAEIINLVETFQDSIDTNIEDDDVPLFVKLGQKVDTTKIRRIVLDNTREDSVLTVGEPQEFGGQFVLVPKGTWTDLAEYLQSEIFKLEEQ